MAKRSTPSIADWVSVIALRGALGLLRLLPYRQRVLWGGKVFAAIAAPLAGYRKRIAANLDLVVPELDAGERARIIRNVPEMVARTFVELFSPEDFSKVAQAARITGPGLAAIEAAQEKGQPFILVSGHYGNYDVVRANLIGRGFKVGGLYRRMNNPLFHEVYIATISRIGLPLFERGKTGMGEMMRFMKQGGSLAMLVDQHMGAGEPLTFFGRTAFTATSAAKLALRYNALLVPVYATRQADGLSFEMELEAPIPAGDATEMTQALNDSLEAKVRANMEQWLWVHRRWKGHGA